MKTTSMETRVIATKYFLFVAVVFVLAGCATRPAVLGGRTGGRTYQHVVFSPDSRFLATSCIWGDESIVFDLSTRTECSHFKPDKSSQAGMVAGLFYTPDGRLLAAYWGKDSVTVWDTGASNLVSRLAISNAPGFCALSPDGRWLATRAKNKPPTIWEVATARKTAELTNGPTADVALAFSHDGRWLAAAGLNQGVGVWDTASGQRISELPSPRGEVRHLAFAPDDSRLAVSAEDVSVFCLTNAKSGPLGSIPAPSMSRGAKVAGVLWMLLSTFGAHPSGSSEVFSTAPSGPIEFSPTGTHLAIINSAANVDTALAHGAEQVRVFDLSHTNLVSTVAYDTQVSSIAFSPDGKWIATAGDAVNVWDWANGGRNLVAPTAFAPVVVCLQTNFQANRNLPPARTSARPVLVGAFTDARPQEILGERTAAFKVKMNDVLPARPVAESVRDAVATLFAGSAKLADGSPAALTIAGTVRKFSVQTPASLLDWKIEAEVELELRINDAAGNVVHSATYRGQAHHTTAVWPSESLIEKTCNEALQQLLGNIHADPFWQTI